MSTKPGPNHNRIKEKGTWDQATVGGESMVQEGEAEALFKHCQSSNVR